VRGAAVLLTVLADGTAVEETVRGIDAFPLWIQVSTVGVDATEKLMELGTRRRAIFVDAPVPGSREPAQRGDLVILASGPEEARARCEPIFDVIDKKTIRVDGAGAGRRLKLVVNLWLLSLVATLAETVALARGLDVDPQPFLDAIFRRHPRLPVPAGEG
jgi:3-hydroxyisobutyrate dehydrogenase